MKTARGLAEYDDDDEGFDGIKMDNLLEFQVILLHHTQNPPFLIVIFLFLDFLENISPTAKSGPPLTQAPAPNDQELLNLFT